MAELSVVSWNVLHRIHAVNWSEPVIDAWPIETMRCEAVAAWISRCAADVICLQEVSGDQLIALRSSERGRGDVLATAYPRVPTYRRGPEPSPLVDPTEFLVTIVRGGAGRVVAASAFPTDGGKGFQRVELALGATVIGAHVTYGDASAAQCARLAAEAGAADGLAVVCGDFNADRETCARQLGPDLVAAIPHEASLPTRPRPASSEKSQTIDHLFVRGGVAREVEVLAVDGLSDHNAVRARIAWTPASPKTPDQG